MVIGKFKGQLNAYKVLLTVRELNIECVTLVSSNKTLTMTNLSPLYSNGV